MRARRDCCPALDVDERQSSGNTIYMGSQSFEFAGVKTKSTVKGWVRKAAVLKILRSGRVRVVTCRQFSDDYGFDSAEGFRNGRERDPLEVALSIEEDGLGWRAWFTEGHMALTRGDWLSLEIYALPLQSIAAKNGARSQQGARA